MTDQKENVEKITKKPIPKAILVLIPAVATIGLATIFFIYNLVNESSNAEQIESSDLSPISPSELIKEEVEESAVTGLNHELLNSIPTLISDNDNLKLKVHQIEQTNNKAVQINLKNKTKIVDDHQNLVAKHIELEGKVNKLADILKLLESQNLALSDEIKKLKITKVKATKKRYVKPVKKSKPNFSLVNIQKWDSKTIAIINFKQTQISVSQDESVDGWKINIGDNSGCIDVTKAKQVVKLCQ